MHHQQDTQPLSIDLVEFLWNSRYVLGDVFQIFRGWQISVSHGLITGFICALTDRFADPWSEHDPVIWRINQVSIVESHYIKISIGLIFNLTPLIPHFIKVSITSLHSTLFQWRTTASFESDARSHAINMTSNSRWYLFDVFIMHKYLK